MGTYRASIKHLLEFERVNIERDNQSELLLAAAQEPKPSFINEKDQSPKNASDESARHHVRVQSPFNKGTQ
jgi:hypothetical protein